jgi:hypothetical protein
MLNASGLCECGCGEPTKLAPYSLPRLGWVAGEPIRFVKGHSGHKFTRPDGLCAPMGSKIEARARRTAYRAAVTRIRIRRRGERERELASLNALAMG